MSSVLVFFNGNSIPFTSFKSKVLYMSFGKFLLAVESRDLSQAKQEYYTRVFFFNLTKLEFLNDKIYSYSFVPKKKLFAKFGQFDHSKICKIKKQTFFSFFS